MPASLADLDRLNALLRAELSAAETYDLALSTLAGEPDVSDVLEAGRRGHRQRAALLRRGIVELGGIPSDVCGIWGSFADVQDPGASDSGRRAALAALRRGERYLLQDYARGQDELSPRVRRFLCGRLEPMQRQTLLAVVRLTVDAGEPAAS